MEFYPEKYTIGEKMFRLYYKFPAGIREGHVFKIKDIGNRDLLDPLLVGNLEIHVNYKAHPQYRLDFQYNMIQVFDISVFDSMLGFDMKDIGFEKDTGHIWPMYGKREQVFKGKGLKQDDRYTDLIIKFNVIYPTLSDNQQEIIRLHFGEYLVQNESNNDNTESIFE
jgi:DnaJ-class molecular chaperone